MVPTSSVPSGCRVKLRRPPMSEVKGKVALVARASCVAVKLNVAVAFFATGPLPVIPVIFQPGGPGCRRVQ